MMHHNFAIGFVTYFPTENFNLRIEKLLEIGMRIYVFDNSPDSKILYDHKNAHINYITAGKNIGLGFALSTIAATAYSKGEERLLFLDQDTVISSETITFIDEYLRKSNFEELRQYVAIVFSGKENKLVKSGELVNVTLAINSGSLFILDNLKIIGWHNEKYFVDGVDYDLCLRALLMNYKVGVCYNTHNFDHVSEQPDKILNIFGKNLLVRKYSISRVLDSLTAYSKLIYFCIKNMCLVGFLTIVRSLAIYLLGQILAHTYCTFLRKK